jgi:hypothetical protein
LGGVIGGLLVGGLAVGAMILIHNSQTDVARQNWTDQVIENHSELVRLGRETRLVQSADVTKAMMRIFERLQVDREKLRVLDHVYIFEDEENLFDEESRERKLGDLRNKSIRLISPGNFRNEAFRVVRMDDSGENEFFFNPIRLVMLLLTETQLVVCDVQIDSMDGSLLEETQRVALSKIVNVHFRAERTRLSLSRDELLRMAEDRQMDQSVIDQLKHGLGGGAAAPGDWAVERLSSTLNVSRTDGGSLAMPIRSEIHFGKQHGTLDEDGRLNEHEIKVDRMVNELNRLVDSG